jgi:hypothetical protein
MSEDSHYRPARDPGRRDLRPLLVAPATRFGRRSSTGRDTG